MNLGTLLTIGAAILALALVARKFASPGSGYALVGITGIAWILLAVGSAVVSLAAQASPIVSLFSVVTPTVTVVLGCIAAIRLCWELRCPRSAQPPLHLQPELEGQSARE